MADIQPAADALVVDLTDHAPEAAESQTDDVAVIGDDDPEGLPPHAKAQEGGTILLPLRHPVTLRYRTPKSERVREEQIAELVFHRLTGADMRAITAVSQDAMAPVSIARSCRIPEAKFHPIYDRMDAEDVTYASRVVAHFLGSGRKTGR